MDHFFVGTSFQFWPFLRAVLLSLPCTNITYHLRYFKLCFVEVVEDLVNLFKTLRKQVMQPGVEYILEASKMCPGRENADMLPNVKERCKEFLIELLKEIKKRLPTSLEQLESLAQLSPEVILSENKPHLSKFLLCSFTKEMLQRLNANGTTSRKSSGTTNTKAQT